MKYGLLAFALAVTGCVTRDPHTDLDLAAQAVRPGMSTQDVERAIGPPETVKASVGSLQLGYHMRDASQRVLWLDIRDGRVQRSSLATE